MLSRRLFILSSLVFAAPALAHSYKAGDIAIGHVWALPVTGDETRVFFPLMNRGKTEDELVAARTSIATQVEFRENNRYDTPAPASFKIEPGKPLPMRAGARHLRLLGLSKPLAKGDKFMLILDFRDAGEVSVEVFVQDKPGE
ncbi:hypothetical protein BH10PSE7_BH10PSE7_14840 [soil metagenome]